MRTALFATLGVQIALGITFAWVNTRTIYGTLGDHAIETSFDDISAADIPPPSGMETNTSDAEKQPTTVFDFITAKESDLSWKQAHDAIIEPSSPPDSLASIPDYTPQDDSRAWEHHTLRPAAQQYASRTSGKTDRSSEQQLKTGERSSSRKGYSSVAGTSVTKKMPQYKTTPLPPYPADAKRMRKEGVVMLLVHVDTTGAPTEVSLSQSSGTACLDQAAIDWVKKKWKFFPAMADNTPIAAQIKVPVRFKLD